MQSWTFFDFGKVTHQNAQNFIEIDKTLLFVV